MTVTIAQLRTELQAGTSIPDEILTSCLSVADTLLRQYTGTDYDDIPPSLYDRAWMAVAVDLFNQRRAPNGVLNQQFSTAEGGTEAVPVRISADPLRPARPLLEQWVIEVGFS